MIINHTDIIVVVVAECYPKCVNGDCVNGKCKCNAGWIGRACDTGNFTNTCIVLLFYFLINATLHPFQSELTKKIDRKP